MAVKDPATLQEPKGGAQSARRDAVGAEIPVTVHASRTNQGPGKNLPPVHEDTKTVIVLQQGAVVRLTAGLTTGETVVLTNRMTGADVLCRVGNVKSQSGIQHYVDLEFIQRAPGFWGDAVAASSAPAISQAPPAAVVPSSSVAPAAHVTVAPVAPAPPLTPIAVAAPPQPPPKLVPIPTPSRPPVRTAPLQPAPTIDLPPAAAAEELQPALLAEPVAASWMAPKSSSVAPVHSAVDRSSFGSISSAGEGHNSPVSHKNLLAAAAAVLLVLGGAAGGWFYSHQTGGANPRAQQQAASAAAPQPMPAAAPPSAPTAPVSAAVPVAAAATAVPQPTPQTDIIIESRPAGDSPAARVQPQPPPAALTRASASRRNIPVEPLKVNAPKAKVATARLDAPAMIGNLNDAGVTNALLASQPAAPAPPPAAARVIGGQLQPPQVLSSRPPVYPVAAKAARIQGIVALDALVDETGKVVETTVVSGPPQLAAAAQESVRGWKYKPAQLNGKPISVHAKVSVNFSLQ